MPGCCSSSARHGSCLDFGTTLLGSLFNALVNDVVPLELIGRFFGLFRIVSLGAGILYNGWLIDRVKTHAAEIFFGIGTLYLLGLLLLCFKVKEGEYPPPPGGARLPPPAGSPCCFRVHAFGGHLPAAEF